MMVGNSRVRLRHREKIQTKTIDLVATILSLIAITTSQSFAVAQELPNIVLIFVDDLGYNDLGSQGSLESLTPNIDSIAANGTRFTQFYAEPVCTPSRLALLTGRHPSRSEDGLHSGISGPHRRRGIAKEATTLAEALRPAGYTTAIIGKWHLGHGDMPADPPSHGAPDTIYHPNNHGFDYFFGGLFGNIDYNTHWNQDLWLDWFENKNYVLGDEGLYATQVFAQKTVEFINNNSALPFFLYIPFTAVHFGNTIDQSRLARTQLPVGEEVRREYLSRFDHLYPSDDNIRKRNLSMVAVLDDAVGDILDAIRGNGLELDTIVIFASDNGGSVEFGGNNTPLRGQKGLMYEGGIRVPAIFQWRGVFQEGRVTDQLGMIIDLFPTLTALAGMDNAQYETDGIDLSSHLRGGPVIDRDILLRNPVFGDAFRQGNWKLVRRNKGPSSPSGFELYDLGVDISEQTELSSDYPDVVETLRDEFARQLFQTESRVIARVSSSWQARLINGVYRKPIVILGVPSTRGADPGVARLRNVTLDSFEVRFQEWEYLDRTHPNETLPNLVLEEGRHQMADGSVWEVGSFTLDGTRNWVSQGFSEAFPETPRVFLTVQTENGWQAVTARARDVTVHGFSAALFEQESLKDGHVTEVVGYLAIYSPNGTGRVEIGGRELPYLLQQVAVDERWMPILSFNLRLQEEQSADEEIDHTEEAVDILVLGPSLFAQQVSHNGPDTVSLRHRALDEALSMEWGAVDGVDHNWRTVPLARRYENPVVVAKPASFVGKNSGVIQVRNVTEDSFDIRFQEWSYLDGIHKQERVFYLAAEAGITEVAGLTVEAGSFRTRRLLQDGWETVSFSSPFLEPPAVFTGVMSSQGVDPVTTRVDGVTATGFLTVMQEEQAKRDGHGTETLGWIAVQRGNGVVSDRRFFSVQSGVADHVPRTVQFGRSFSGSFPVLVSDIVTTIGRDPVVLRYQNLRPTSVGLFLQEEASLDAELSHVAEDISIFLAD